MVFQLIYIFYVAVFFYLAYSDYKTRRIPNRIIFPAMVIVTLLNCFLMPIGWMNTLIGGGIGLGAAIIFFICLLPHALTVYIYICLRIKADRA